MTAAEWREMAQLLAAHCERCQKAGLERPPRALLAIFFCGRM